MELVDPSGRMWMIRPGEGSRMAVELLRDGVVGIPFPKVPDGRTVDRSKVLRLLGGGDEPSQAIQAQALQFLTFVNRMAPPDVVLLPDPGAGDLVIGILTGDYRFESGVDERRCRHRRPVEWRRRLATKDLSERAATLATQRQVVTEVTDGRLRDFVHRALDGQLGRDAAVPVSRTATPRSPSRRAAPAAVRPEPAPTRRCVNCLMSRPLTHFPGGGEWCEACS